MWEMVAEEDPELTFTHQIYTPDLPIKSFRYIWDNFLWEKLTNTRNTPPKNWLVTPRLL